MRLTSIGVISTVTLGILPFLPRLGLFYGAVSTKALLITLVTGIIALLGASLLLKESKRKSLKKRFFTIAIIAVLLALLVSSIAGVFFEHSLWADVLRSTGVLFIAHLAVLAYLMGKFLTEDDWVVIRRTIVISAGVFSVLSIVGVGGFGYSGHLLWFNLGQLGISLGNDTYAGVYLVLAFLLGCIELIRNKSSAWSKYLLTSLTLIGVSPFLFNTSLFFGRENVLTLIENPLLLLGSARASSLAFFAFLSFIAGWILLGRLKSRTWRNSLKKLWSGLFVASIIIGSATLLVPYGPVQKILFDETMSARFIVWNSLGPAIQERPFFGWGPENFDQAFERYFNKDLYARDGALEVWFSKAHNIVLDSLVSIGIIGSASLLLLLSAYIWVVIRAFRNKTVSELESVLLIALPFVHFIQLQTGFDTVVTLALLAVVGGYVLWLERKQLSVLRTTSLQRKITAAIMVLIGISSLAAYLIYEYPRQRALVEAVGGGSIEQRAELTKLALSRVSDFEGLHRSSTIFVEDLFSGDENTFPQDEKELLINTYIPLYKQAYERYLERQPEHYRARMNYAYLLLVDTSLGSDSIARAVEVIEGSYVLSPQNPLTYVLHAMAYVYSDNIAAAEAKVIEASQLHPGVEIVQDTAEWVAKQKQQYPKKNFLFIGNI